MAADELVRVRIGNVEKNMGRSLAEEAGVTILDDEPVINGDGSYRDDTGKDGRPLKPRTSVNDEADKKAVTAAPKKETSK